jgi:hypothetical protein
MTTLTTQEEIELEIEFLLWDLLEFETLGEFLMGEELGELELNTHTTFGEKFLNMVKVWPLKGVIVQKGYLYLKEADE